MSRDVRGHGRAPSRYGAGITDFLPASVKAEIDSLQSQATDLRAQLEQAKREAAELARQAGTLLNLRDPSALVEWIMIESEYTPTIRVLGPLSKDPPGTPVSTGGRILRVLKPKVSIKFRELDRLIVITPFGVPRPTRWPMVVLGVGVVGGGLLGYLLAGKKGALGGALLGGVAVGGVR